MERKKVVLVTGGSGLVGTAVESYVKIAAKEKETWIFVGQKDAELRDLEATKALFERHEPTHVLHLAAFVGGLFRNMKQPVDFFRWNHAMNENVMHCCHLFHVQKLVSCLSTCIFPDKTAYPITEVMIHNGPPHESNIGYAMAKRLIDTMNRCYYQQYGSMFTAVIPTNVYGPQDNFNIEDGHVIPGLIHKCYLAKVTQSDFVVYGSGKPLRQFVFNQDLARLMVWTLHDYNSIEPLILSVDETDEISIEQVAKAIGKCMNFSGKIVFDTSKADGQYKKTACNAKLRSLMPEFKFTSIEEGLEATVSWFLKHYDTARK